MHDDLSIKQLLARLETLEAEVACKGRSKTAAVGGRLIRGFTRQHGTSGKSPSLLPAPRPAFGFPR
jgi:hypothetical protein